MPSQQMRTHPLPLPAQINTACNERRGKRETRNGMPASATAISGDTAVSVASQPESAEVVDGFAYCVRAGRSSGETLESVGSWGVQCGDGWRGR